MAGCAQLEKGFRRLVWNPKVFVAVVVLGVFIYQLSLNLEIYLQHRTVFTSSEETFIPNPFPPYRVCVWPSWHPRRLLSLDFNISGLTHKEIEDKFHALSGINSTITGRRLVETAAWRPNDLLEEVKVGNIHEVYETNATFPSVLWKRSFSPLGPCFTLTVPSSATEHSLNVTIKFRERAADMDPCQCVGVNDESSQCHIIKLQDRPSKQSCNTSYGWPNFIAQFQLVIIHDLLFSSNSFWISDKSNEIRLPNVQMGTNIITEPFTVIPIRQDPRKDAETCYYKCLMADGEKRGKCVSLMEDSLNETIGNLCLNSDQQWYVSNSYVALLPGRDQCLNYCTSRRTVSRWRYKLDTINPVTRTVFTMRLEKRANLILREKEVYPVSQFLAKAGGGLGLFLGVSALDGWNFIVEVILVRVMTIIRSNDLGLIKHLAQLTGTMIALGMTCVHFLVILSSFLELPATFTAKPILLANESQNYTMPVTLESLLVERMASRVLGCRVSRTAKVDECVRCLLRNVHDQSLHFISVNDLPRCGRQHLNLPHSIFTVNKPYIHRVTSKEISCQACLNLNENRQSESDAVEYIIKEDASGSLINLLCNIGGLLGLYLGLSLMNVVDILKMNCIKHQFKLGGRSLVMVRKVCILCVVVPTVIVCLFYSFTLFEGNPISSTASLQGIEENVLPGITLCVWPPVNIKRLLKTAGLGTAFDDITVIKDLQKRHVAITSLLQNLPHTSNVTEPRILWEAGAWMDHEISSRLSTIQDANEFSCSGHKKVNTVLNHCQTYSPTAKLSKSMKDTIYSLSIAPVNETHGLYYSFLVFLHYPDEVSFSNFKLLKLRDSENIKITAVTRWKPLVAEETPDKGECVSQCLDSLLMEHLGCRLPSALRRKDLPPCNMTQFTYFLTSIWRLGTQPQNIYKHFIGQNQTMWCHISCAHRSQTFFMSKLWSKNKLFSSVVPVSINDHKHWRFTVIFRFVTGLVEHASAYGGYSTTQMVSDFGSILGMTLGVSLLSLLLMFVGNINQPKRIFNKVYSLPSVQ